MAVFCEKPVAVDAATVERMVAAVEAAGVVNQVGLVLRFLPSFRWLRHLIGDPRAGRVLAAVFRDDQYIPDQGIYGSTWRTDAARAGGARCSSTRSTTSTSCTGCSGPSAR